MSETLTETGEVAAYLAAVREALTDLDPADRDDLIEDLEAHLHEVVAEAGGASLESSLGSPAAYAAELRMSAGLPPVPEQELPLRRRVEQAVTGSSFWRTAKDLLALPLVRDVADFARSLRPAWWLVRGWLAVAIAVALVEDYRYRYHYQYAVQRWLVFPTYHSHAVVGVVAVAAAALMSVWLGRRSDERRRLRLLGVVGNTFLVILAGFTLTHAERVVFGPTYSSSGPASAVPFQPVDGLRLNGRQLVNIFPYDANGHALQQVRLYDDQGRPVQGLSSQTDNGLPIVRVLPTDARGAQVKNEYPQQAAVQTPAYVDPVASMGALVSAAATTSASDVVVTTGAAPAGLPIPAPGIVVPPIPAATSAVPSLAPSPTEASRAPTPPTPATSTKSSKPTGTGKATAPSKSTTRPTTSAGSGVGGAPVRTP